MRYLIFAFYVILTLVWVHLLVWSNLSTQANFFLLLAVFLWIYMAVNIWANDVANSVWPAVWSGALKLKHAIIIAAVFELLWAVIAWWEVVKTVKNGIIDVNMIDNISVFIFIMMAALFSAAAWLNLATYFKAPVSTTHSIVWWVMWAWIAALWFWVVDWWTMWKIVSSWFISPLLGWLIAALFLYLIKSLILFRDNKVSQSKKWVPFFVAIMSWAFVTFLAIKWLKHIVSIDFVYASHMWLIVWFFVYFFLRSSIWKKASKITNDRQWVAKLFNIPLVFAVVLLTFAHWSNDVANAIWPLAAIYDSLVNSWINWSVWIPFWILLLWWTGLSFWLLLFWPRIIKAVGSEITELDQIRAFCIAISAALTVILASQLWLPVSTTHVAIGWVFWVWFLREYLHKKHHGKKEKFVQRNMMFKIISAWLITVPIVAFISWMFFVLFNFMFI